MFTKEEERGLMRRFTDSFTGKLMIGIVAGVTIYISGILTANYAIDYIIGQTIKTQEQLEQVIQNEAKKLGLNSSNIAGVLFSSGNEASYSTYSDGDIGIVMAGRKANVPSLRKILYQINSGVGFRDEVKYSDLLLVPNAIFYGITGGILKRDDF